jgi:hypothetical protein
MLGTLALAGVMLFAPVAGAQTGKPACSTFNEQNEPSPTFDAGEKVIVRGTGFGAKSLVFVRFEQGTRNAELVRPTANDLGAFTTQATAFPADVIDGPATIRALDARGAATCDVTMRGGSSGDEGGLGGLYLVWGAALALFAVILGVLTYRRYKAERLNAAMDKLSFTAPAKAKATSDAWELDAWEQEAASARQAPAPVPPGSADVRAWGRSDESGADATDEDDVEWFDPEADPASVKDPRIHVFETDEPLEPEPEPEPEPEQGPEPEPEPEPEPAPHVASRPHVEEPSEPPHLPVGWDAGRLRPNRQTSDAIERLRREVRTWGRS